MFRLEESLYEICFVGIKEQMINDSEMLVMMHDERRNKTEKKQEHVLSFVAYTTFVFQHLMETNE